MISFVEILLWLLKKSTVVPADVAFSKLLFRTIMKDSGILHLKKPVDKLGKLSSATT